MATGSDALDVLAPVDGVRLGIASAGIKEAGRKDLVVIELDAGVEVAAVFTRNAFCAAPVTLAREHLQAGAPRYLLINTGNANAGTGERGLADAGRCCETLAALAGVDAVAVLPFSTGVIGELLPVARIEAALPAAFDALAPDCWAEAAAAIMTTDTRPKGASRTVVIGNREVRITGIAKGAGMIRPNMATMLAFVATDAEVASAPLQALLADTAERSFNRITVDGDTSTNDACVLMATGRSGASLQANGGAEWQQFADAVGDLMRELAQAIVRDGEGATKFVTVTVSGAVSTIEALDVAFAVAGSPLVKTALFASDPNWGRILAAVGRADINDLDVNGVTVHLNGVLLAEQGARAAGYTEEQGQRAMAPEDIGIAIDLGRGSAVETVWTTDLSHDYVRINAEYRT